MRVQLVKQVTMNHWQKVLSAFLEKMRIPDAPGETGKDEEKGEHGPPGLLVYI